jgi:hypothetical protein
MASGATARHALLRMGRDRFPQEFVKYFNRGLDLVTVTSGMSAMFWRGTV